jgi:RNA polymerase sigma factor (sigma-70 family)
MESMAPDVVATLVEHHQRFREFLERRVGSRAEAEELLQAAFVKGVERGGELRDGESAVAWFYRLLRNAVVDFYRHRAAQQRAFDRHGREIAVTTEPDHELHEAVCQCVDDLIGTLKPEYADILRAVEIDGQALATVAGRFGITPGNASVRLHRARQALKERLEASCGTCTEHGCLDCTCKG